MNMQVDPLKIAIAKHLKRDALDELRVLVEVSEKDVSNVPIDELERRALILVESREIMPELIDVISRTARVFYVAANSDRGLYLAERLREQAEQNGYGRSESILPLLNTIGLCALDASDHVTATEVLDDGLRLADELGIQRFQVMFRTSLVAALMLAGLFAEASAVSEKSIQLALNEPKLISFIISCEANLLYANLILGRHTTSISLITSRRFSKPPQSERETFARIYFEANAAQVYADAGYMLDAKRHLVVAKKWLSRYRSTRAAMAVEMAEGFVKVCDGDLQNGLAAMEAVIPKASAVSAGAIAYLPILSKAYDRAGRPQEVLRYTRTMIDQQVALQEKNILRHTRLNRAALDATTSETIIAESPNLLARLLTHAQILEGQVAKIELMNAQQKLFRQRTEMLERMAVMAALRDDASGERVYRVGRLASLLTHMLGEDDHTVFMMEMAARLHDIGKISIPDSVVQKASMYAPAEHDMMKMHTTIGADMLAKSEITELQMAEQIARYHHEHWDGSGYPEGLKRRSHSATRPRGRARRCVRCAHPCACIPTCLHH
jgi:putative two-component system response regulator